ncbi:amino acid ABC transporter ATP-binding protein [Nesterenkonia ebinurensis]|uniref:amino acid ABC transporter ATP-binding protein n=1 Tax=Nesterenkonia ebinurensis TaxID=2608252 RepID=UPI00123CC474|nr:amino acid ABC transporter ATP-binding protein [Nesterenkonia ebinurensis]
MVDSIVSVPPELKEKQLREPTIVVEGLTKRFGDTEVLKGISFDVKPGEVLSIIGPSGTGKSTVIRCLNLLETPTSGTVSILGQQVSTDGRTLLSQRQLEKLRSRAGMVFQTFNVFPHLTALENVTLAQQHVLGRSKSEARTRAMSLLERVGLGERANFKPNQLSGGQKQRVAIARALALDPEVLLLDEPTSAIDPELRVEVRAVIDELAASGMTMVLVTHEVRYAARLSDRMLFLSDGVVVESGTPDQVVGEPQQERTRRFLHALEDDGV